MDDLRIEYDNPQAVYFPGTTVTGRVIIQNRETIKARHLRICIHGGAHTHWTEYEQRRRRDAQGKEESYSESIPYSARVDYLTGESMPWQSPDEKLPAGQHIFPFAFNLPLNCPPSFEGRFGCIRYMVHVELDRPWRFNKKSKQCFTVIPAFDLNITPGAINPMQSTTSKNTGLLFKKGVVNMTVNVPKRGFVPGETIPITVLIDNGSKKPVVQVRAKLVQESTFYARRGSSNYYNDPFAVGYRHATHETKIDSKLVTENRRSLNVCAQTKDQVVLPLKLPAIVPSFNTCPIISTSYCLHVKIDTSSTFGSTIKAEFPIIIGTIPIRHFVAPAGTTLPVPPPYSGAIPSAPSMPSGPSPSAPFDQPPPYQDGELSNASAPPPPSYEESMYGTAGTTKDSDDVEPFAPRYPVYNNLEDTHNTTPAGGAAPLPHKQPF